MQPEKLELTTFYTTGNYGINSQDQRVRLVSLTTQGELTLKKAIPLWERAQARVIEQLGQQRWNTLLLSLCPTVSLLHLSEIFLA